MSQEIEHYLFFIHVASVAYSHNPNQKLLFIYFIYYAIITHSNSISFYSCQLFYPTWKWVIGQKLNPDNYFL